MAIIDCKNCGKPMSDKALKCPHCGAEQDVIKQSPVNPNSNQEEKITVTEKELDKTKPSLKPKREKTITVILYIILGLIIVGGGIAFLVSSNKTDNVDAIEVTQNDDDLRKELSNTYYSDELLQKAESGDLKAQLALAYAYKNGNGITQNYNEAYKWFKKSAEGGNVWAQHDLGVMYEKGVGCEQNEVEAVKWYMKAAESGLAEAQCNLGYAYQYGKGIQQNYTKAVKWYMKAAEQNDALAQFNLSLCYEHGLGVEENLSESVKWLKKAADNGEAVAQFNLGLSYYDGYGVEKNYDLAIKYLQDAANQGMEKAISILNQLGVQ